MSLSSYFSNRSEEKKGNTDAISTMHTAGGMYNMSGNKMIQNSKKKFPKPGESDSEEENDWFKDDFGLVAGDMPKFKKKPESEYKQKNAAVGNTSKSGSFLFAESASTGISSLGNSGNDPKKSGGRRKRDDGKDVSAFLEEHEEEEEEVNPLLKKAKKASKKPK
mmetsp:Transcript_22181/g.19013  ORF Transcript_22181/g.19013 Transcript_22181/m.19013 type:complete len:164 (+) Transcript_22181:488-979(+)